MTTRYNPRWKHAIHHQRPTEIDAMQFPRFYRREYVFPDGWTCRVRDIRYNPDPLTNPEQARAAIFEYDPMEAA